MKRPKNLLAFPEDPSAFRTRSKRVRLTPFTLCSCASGWRWVPETILDYSGCGRSNVRPAPYGFRFASPCRKFANSGWQNGAKVTAPLLRQQKNIRPLRSEQSMFRFRTSKQVLFECEARVHLLQLKRLQLISERSTGRELLCGTFLSAQESTMFYWMKYKAAGCGKF